MRIRILPEAERDLDLGADFYEAQSPGAGASFIRGLLDDIDGLLKHGGVFFGGNRARATAEADDLPEHAVREQRTAQSGESSAWPQSIS